MPRPGRKLHRLPPIKRRILCQVTDNAEHKVRFFKRPGNRPFFSFFNPALLGAWGSRPAQFLLETNFDMCRSGYAVLLILMTGFRLMPEIRAQSSTNVVVAFATTNAMTLNQGFAGFTTELLGTGMEYGDTNLQHYAAMLPPGWLLFPAGETGDAFYWASGMTDTNWVNQFERSRHQPRMDTDYPDKASHPGSSAVRGKGLLCRVSGTGFGRLVSIAIRRSLLQSREVLKCRRIARCGIGRWQGAQPFPVFHMPIGKCECVAVLMSPRWNIAPFIACGCIKKMPVVNRRIIFINKRKRLGWIDDLTGFVQRFDAKFIRVRLRPAHKAT